MNKNPKTGAYNLDGTRHTNLNEIPPLYLIMPEDVDARYDMGWYFCDEASLLQGPFNTFEEAVEAFKNYEV